MKGLGIIIGDNWVNLERIERVLSILVIISIIFVLYNGMILIKRECFNVYLLYVCVHWNNVVEKIRQKKKNIVKTSFDKIEL